MSDCTEFWKMLWFSPHIHSPHSLPTPPGQALNPQHPITTETHNWKTPCLVKQLFWGLDLCCLGMPTPSSSDNFAWNFGTGPPICLRDVDFLSSANSESSRVSTKNFKNCLLITVVMLRIEQSGKISLLTKNHWTSKTDRCFLFTNWRCQKILWSSHLGIKIFPSKIKVFVYPNL